MGELILPLVGASFVFIVMISRFNIPVPMYYSSGMTGGDWASTVKSWFRMQQTNSALFSVPLRSNTTIFKYRLYQCIYAMFGLAIYVLLMHVPGALEQLQVVISWLAPQDTVPLIRTGAPLVIAAFVILILPNVPPFRGADISLRRVLLLHASVPAQQLRERNRLKKARYIPPADEIRNIKQEAVLNGFEPDDISYNAIYPTTQSLWAKCMLLNRQIKTWEADDRYKTAFALIYEPGNGGLRYVERVQKTYNAICSDARICFTELRKVNIDIGVEAQTREENFRTRCKSLLDSIYDLLSRVSLHAHYSEKERIEEFGKLGFHLSPSREGPIPDANEVAALGLILGGFLVIPLGLSIGYARALLIGAIIFSAILTPVITARIFPRLVDTRTRHAPALAFPVLCGFVAVITGIAILLTGAAVTGPSQSCLYTGWMQYTNCSYPWSIVHAMIAILISWRMRVGNYPDIRSLFGLKKYQAWGKFTDGLIFLVIMVLLVLFIVIPELESLGRQYDHGRQWVITVRLGLLSFIIGFIVPTWYRAHSQRTFVDRRVDSAARAQFEAQMRQNVSV